MERDVFGISRSHTNFSITFIFSLDGNGAVLSYSLLPREPELFVVA